MPPLIRIEHVALWTRDLEGMRAFYVERLGGTSSGLYHNERTGFRSYFIALAEGARIELMSRPEVADDGSRETTTGWAHIALALGSPAAVDRMVEDLEAVGVAVSSRARTTGDGYYEAVIEDPEGNRIELTA